MPSADQTITDEDRTRITLVAQAMGRRTPEPEIVSALVGSGIPKQAAGEFYSLVAHGLRAGVLAGVTNGLSAQQHHRGKSPLWHAAFDEGSRQFSGVVRSVWLRRLVWLVVPILLFIVWLLWRKR